MEAKDALQSYYQIFCEINAIYEKLAKLHGLTSTSLFVLQTLVDNKDNCTQQLISKSLCYPKQTVNSILNAFIYKGYIVKEVAPADKRVKYLLLTEKGKIYAAEVLRDMQKMEEEAFAQMSESERNAMFLGEQAFYKQLAKSFAAIARGKSETVKQ